MYISHYLFMYNRGKSNRDICHLDIDLSLFKYSMEYIDIDMDLNQEIYCISK